MSVKCENCDYSYMGYESSSMDYKLLCQEYDSPCSDRTFRNCNKYSNKVEDIKLLESENSELRTKLQELESQIEKMKVEIERRKNCYDCADDCDHCPLRNYLKPVIGN